MPVGRPVGQAEGDSRIGAQVQPRLLQHQRQHLPPQMRFTLSKLFGDLWRIQHCHAFCLPSYTYGVTDANPSKGAYSCMH